MKRRCLYIDDDPWAAAKRLAARRGITVSEYIRQALNEKLLNEKLKGECRKLPSKRSRK